MNPIVYAIPIFGLTILLEAWVAHRRRLAVYDIPDAITSLQMGVLSQVTNAFTKVVAFGIYTAVYDSYRATAWPINSLAAWVLALLVYDFFYYWFHRLNHEVGVLWAAHVVHHSSEYYNLSTALRQSSTTALLGWLFYLPMAVAGVPPMMFIVVSLINLLYQYWPHTQLIGRLGWVDRVFVTPSNHRVHHGQNEHCIDVNYGGILIVWDRLFGTYAEERVDEPVCFGVRKPLASFNPVWGNLKLYADLWRASRRERGWRNRLSVWLAPPGGWVGDRSGGRSGMDPADPSAGFDAQRFTRFEAGTSMPIRCYAALQYALTSVLVMHFLAVIRGLTLADGLAYAALIVLTAVAMGGLLERRPWGRWLELARLLVVGAGFVVMPLWFGTAMPLAVRLAVALMAIVSATWLLRQPGEVVAKQGLPA